MRIFLFLLLSCIIVNAQRIEQRRGGLNATNGTGSAGQVLLTDGTNFYWGNPTNLSATATNAIANNNGLGTNTTFYGTFVIPDGAIMLQDLTNIAEQTIMGRNSAGTGVPETLTIHQVLDWFGAPQGSLIYRGAAAWAHIAPSNSGYFLQTLGAAQNPVWAPAAGGGGAFNVDQFSAANGVTSILSGFKGTNANLVNVTNTGLLRNNGSIVSTNGNILFGNNIIEGNLLTNRMTEYQEGAYYNFSALMTFSEANTLLLMEDASGISIGNSFNFGEAPAFMSFGTNDYIYSVADAEINRYRFYNDITGNNTNLVIRWWEMSNYVAAVSPGGGENTGTNVNQFGAAGAILTLKDGLLVTNPVVHGKLTVNSNLGITGITTNMIRTAAVVDTTNAVVNATLGDYWNYVGALTNYTFSNLVVGQRVKLDVFPSTAVFPVLWIDGVQVRTHEYLGTNAIIVDTNVWSEISVFKTAGGSNLVEISTREFGLAAVSNGVSQLNLLTNGTTGMISVSNSASLVAANGISLHTNGSVTTISNSLVGAYNYFWIPAGSMISNGTDTTTGSTGATNGTLETGTNKRLVDMFSFDDTVTNAVQVSFALPYDWDTNTLMQVKLHWTSTNSQANETVAWGVETVSTQDDGALDTAFGTEVVITDDVLAANDVMLTAASGDITPAGVTIHGTLISLRIRRLGTHASDDCDGLARLLGAYVRYKRVTTIPAVNW